MNSKRRGKATNFRSGRCRRLSAARPVTTNTGAKSIKSDLRLERLRQIEIDQACTAFHEAGHAVLLLACGAKWVKPWIAPKEHFGLNTEKAFNGSCGHSEVRGKIKLAMVGYAGHLAEGIATDSRCGGDILWTLSDFNETEHKVQWIGSGTDRAYTEELVHERRRVHAFEQCGLILREHWRAVSGIAFHVHSFHRMEFNPSDLKKERWDGLLEPVDLPQDQQCY